MRRFDRRQREPRTNRHQIFEFFPEQLRWVQVNGEQSGDLASPEPLDDISFLYFVRTLPLAVGDKAAKPKFISRTMSDASSSFWMPGCQLLE